MMLNLAQWLVLVDGGAGCHGVGAQAPDLFVTEEFSPTPTCA